MEQEDIAIFLSWCLFFAVVAAGVLISVNKYFGYVW